MDESDYLLGSVPHEALENEVREVGEVDSSSTIIENIQMDGESEETNEHERQDTPSSDIELELNEELQAGYKILNDLMSHSKRAANWPFMESVEVSAPELYEVYRQRIEKPIWLKLIKQKFEEHQYTTITEFVSDFRLMLENCYRFNGPDHYISKRAQKMETMLEQKLALLPRDLRDKTTIDATSETKGESTSTGIGLRRRPKSHVLHDSTYLLNQLREAEYQKKKEFRIRQIMARRAEREALAQEIMDWEDKVLFDNKKEIMKAMWEIPQIGLFLFLCQHPLNIGEVMHFELERSFMMARESSTMHLIMTSLLSTPFQRLKLDKKNLMPYKVWEQKLRIKLENWYKTFSDCNNDVEKTCNKLGIDEQFFEVVGHKNPMVRKRYHELSFYRKVWIMKSLCDHCLHNQESLRETIEIQPSEDQREYILGTDNTGQRYIHFPQFCGADVRVYRQAPVKYPKIEIKPDPFDSKRKYPFVYKPPPLKKVKLKKKRHKPASKPVSETPSPSLSPLRQRPSRLRQAPKSVVPLQLQEENSITEGTDSVSSDDEDNNEAPSKVEYPEPVAGTSADFDPGNDSISNDKEGDSQSVESSGSDATLPYCDNSDSNSNMSSRDCSRDCSRDSSPYPSCSDLSLPYGSRIDRSSDLSQESSPCPSPGDFGRRSARFDRYSDTSRDASPLIFDSDFGLRRSSRNRARLKNVPPLRAARDLSTFLMDENSASNSSLAGENSLSGLSSTLFKGIETSRRSSKSSEVTEDSNDCDIQVSKLFTNSKTTNSAVNNNDFHKVLHNETDDVDENLDNGEFGKSGSFGKSLMDTGTSEPLDSVNSNSQLGMVKSITEENDDSIVESLPEINVNISNVKESTNISGDIINIHSEVDKSGVLVSDLLEEKEDLNMAEEIDQSENENNTNLEIELSSQKVVDETNALHSAVNHSCLHSDMESTDDTEGVGNSEAKDVKVKVEIENDDSSVDYTEDKSKSDIKLETVKEERDHSQTDLMKVKSMKTELTDKLHSVLENVTETDSESGVKYEKDIKHKDEIVEDTNTNGDKINEMKEEKFKSKNDDDGDMKDDIKKLELDDVKKEESESEEEEDEILPDASQFEMIADSVEELRKLSAQFAEPEPIVIKRGKKELIQRPPPRKKNVVVLHERIEYLLKELEPWESKLQQATRRARLRMRKEMEDYLMKPEDEKTQDWKSSDEETESGESDTEKDTKTEEKSKPKINNDGKTSAGNSRCSTPVKLPEEIEEIDISHRGRLRKRRIIPNNVEDQLAIKKPKPVVKTETTTSSLPTTNQPVIVQSGKTQLVDYADIIRQLQNTGGSAPILIKTTQGGRTVLTSVLPVNASSNNNSSSTQSIQTVRIVSPSAGSISTVSGQIQPQAVKIALPGSSIVSATSKALQHPTIQNLLSGTVAGTKLLPKTSAVTLSAPIVTGNGTSIAQPVVTYPVTPEKNIQKVVLSNQSTQKVQLSPIATPRKIAPHTTASTSPAKPKAKYYAANASTLPINVVQQLIATRGAKLSHGAYKQSILLIPMENEGQSRNVVSSAAVVTVKNQTQTVAGQQISPGSTTLSIDSTAVVSNQPKSSPNTLILPKPQVGSTSPVLSLAPGVPNIQMPTGLTGIPRHRAFLQPAVVDGLNVTRLVHVGIPPKSPTRYPTNETVKTLLEKRKPLDSSGSKLLNALNDVSGSVPNVKVNINQSVSQQISPVYCEPVSTKLEVKPVISALNSSISPIAKAMPLASVFDPASNDVLGTTPKPQQCVITSISAAKLNTLLLQTSAAGAKSIPSLIKLPSKAALDSAVKAVVTSVNITLPTVNIKVPSPTSLPSIGPRRNVTKTIQTMKSPIPVAPRVVTQSSGGQTSLSCADSHTVSSTMMLTSSSASSISASSSPSGTISLPMATGSHVQDGKKVMAKITPQLVLTSKGVVQMTYVSPESGLLMKSPMNDNNQVSTQYDSSSNVPTGNQAVLIQNSAGHYQLIQQGNSAVHQTTLAGNLQQIVSTSAAVSQNLLQTAQPMVALNANGNPVMFPTVRPSSQVSTNSSPPSIVLHNSTYYAAGRKPTPLSLARTSPTLGLSGLVGSPAVAGTTELKVTTPGYVLQPPTSSVLQPSPTSIMSQAGLVSPLLNLQQGLVLPGGVQLASNPMVNQVGLNLLQPGLALQNAANLQSAASPGINFLQKTVSAPPGQQVLNINPLLLNANLSTTSGTVLNQHQNGRSSVTQIGHSISNLITTSSRFNLNTVTKPTVDGATIQDKNLTGMQPNLAVTLPVTSLVSPLPQAMVQVQGSSVIIPSIGGTNQPLNLLGQLAATPNVGQKQLVFQYPSVSQLVSQSPGINQLPVTTSTKCKVLLSPGVKPSVTVNAARLPLTQMSFKSESNGNVAPALNPVNIGQRTSPTQQKLLLFSIGGQLVTGHGVPVTLCDGVLKVVPHGKIKINNQTLTPEQIKQTLAKINEAAAMTLNRSTQQQALGQQTGASNTNENNKVIPVKIVKDNVTMATGPSLAAVDHSYQNNSKDKIATTLTNGNSGAFSLQSACKDIDYEKSLSNHSNVSPLHSQTGFNVLKSELNNETETVDQSSNKMLTMKPMVYSPGYVVCARNSDQVKMDTDIDSAVPGFNIGKLVVDKETKSFVVKAPVKTDLGGGGDASNNSQNHVVKVDAKHEPVDDDEENDDDKLVIDDSVNDKEAALNLLTLANQALAPISKKGASDTGRQTS
ncbi:hypothetical protein ACF0H5_015830 [Mactra antiquata]